jgi:hypothetical protein
MRSSAVVIVAALVAGCQQNHIQPRPDALGVGAKHADDPSNIPVPVEITPAMRSAIERGVAEALKDPESARFGRMAASKRPAESSPTVCGYVNARNSFGGYVGNRPFLGTLISGNGKAAFILVGMGNSDTEISAVFSTCASYGIENF